MTPLKKLSPYRDLDEAEQRRINMLRSVTLKQFGRITESPIEDGRYDAWLAAAAHLYEQSTTDGPDTRHRTLKRIATGYSWHVIWESVFEGSIDPDEVVAVLTMLDPK